jgi:hypothetical protein
MNLSSLWRKEYPLKGNKIYLILGETGIKIEYTSQPMHDKINNIYDFEPCLIINEKFVKRFFTVQQAINEAEKIANLTSKD